MKKRFLGLLLSLLLMAAALSFALCGAAEQATPVLPEGLTLVTWEPSSEHLAIDTEEARALYDQISSGDYPSLEELLNHPVVQQMDALVAYYSELYGDTSLIDTPEREQLRADILAEFLSRGSARKDHVSEEGYWVYEYDGPLKAEYQAVLVLGLPASGKSGIVADPDSDEMDAFILDSDMIKEMIPEFKESHGLAANTVHEESKAILQKAIATFCEGDMKGTNLIIPTVGSNLESLQNRFINPLEAADYNIKVVFVEAKVNKSLASAVRRGLRTGRIISSQVIAGYGDKPMQVYNTLATMVNARGELYGYAPEGVEGLQKDVLVPFTSDVSLPELLGIENEARERVDADIDEVNSQLSEAAGKTTVDLTVADPQVTDDSGVVIEMSDYEEEDLAPAA